VISDPNHPHPSQDPNSPESRIARLLLTGKPDDPNPTESSNQAAPPPPAQGDLARYTDPSSLQSFKHHLQLHHHQLSSPPILTDEDQWQHSQQLTHIETLLMLGRREEAIEFAMKGHHWSLAILIGSVCEKRVYQEVIRAYSETSFPRNSAMNLISLIYSNQAENMIRHGGKVLAAAPAPVAPTAFPISSSSASLSETIWARNLTAVITNKVDDWGLLARQIGDRILQESGVWNRTLLSFPPSPTDIHLRMSLPLISLSL
jgi:hypothetical protein